MDALLVHALLVSALLTPPLLAAVVALLARRATSAAAWFNAATMPVSVAAALAIALHLAGGGAPIAVGTAWRLDALSAVLAVLVTLVATLAAWLAPGLGSGDASRRETRLYRVYANLFAFTMLVAVSTSNLGVMWVAIEATTVTSALLIPVRRTKAALEASWKYLLIGSVGIALAFTGTVLAFVDYAASGGDLELALHWTTLRAAAPLLHPEVARLAFVFLLVGFGTKAGLAPTHTWLPDAHSEAPAPLSAMMSGVLLAVALYAVARWKAIIDLAVGSAFSDTLLLTVGVATIVVGSTSLLAQTHYKRLLAYSSIEHMGLACFGLALGPTGVFAALLHLAGHALAKSTAFLLAGRVYERYGSGEISSVPGLLSAAPGTGVLFMATVLALAGLPPFGLFLSEVLLVKAGWTAGHAVVTGAVLLLILLTFASLVAQLQRMLFGRTASGTPTGERVGLPLALLALPVVVLAWMGVTIPAPLRELLTHAAEVLQP
ncbi:MAG: hydrogenase [Acidobacteria bacterium]|nr:hydrogenase [Acidobacteriota bacterium]